MHFVLRVGVGFLTLTHTFVARNSAMHFVARNSAIKVPSIYLYLSIVA